jgi:hypothetical protein
VSVSVLLTKGVHHFVVAQQGVHLSAVPVRVLPKFLEPLKEFDCIRSSVEDLTVPRVSKLFDPLNGDLRSLTSPVWTNAPSPSAHPLSSLMTPASRRTRWVVVSDPWRSPMATMCRSEIAGRSSGNGEGVLAGEDENWETR